jgi:beta-glucosidase
MKKLLKIFFYTIGCILGLIIFIAGITLLWVSNSSGREAKRSIALAGQEVKSLTVDGFTFRDLNKNGKLDVYEDSRQSLEARVNDLLSQMNLEEKAGTMFIPFIVMKKDGTISEKPSLDDMDSFGTKGTSCMLFGLKLNHFNIFSGTGRKQMAEWYNRLQKLAERTRLGIPVSIASDPRNHFSTNPLTSAYIGDFSLFPEPLGLAAIGDSLLTFQFADIARQEYLAVGIRIALHPMADLATEPR